MTINEDVCGWRLGAGNLCQGRGAGTIPTPIILTPIIPTRTIPTATIPTSVIIIVGLLSAYWRSLAPRSTCGTGRVRIRVSDTGACRNGECRNGACRNSACRNGDLYPALTVVQWLRSYTFYFHSNLRQDQGYQEFPFRNLKIRPLNAKIPENSS